MLNIAVLVSGNGSNLQSIINNIKNEYLKDVNLKLVISNKSNAYALERAKNSNIATKTILKKDYQDVLTFNQAILDTLKENNIDLVVLCGYLSILTENIIKEYHNKIINIHPSLIPAFAGPGFYGMKVHQSAINRGVKHSGATVHFVDEIADNGPILLQEIVNVSNMDTPESLQQKILKIEHQILPKAIKLISENKVIVKDNKCFITGEL